MDEPHDQYENDLEAFGQAEVDADRDAGEFAPFVEGMEYPIAIVDREDIESGVYLIASEEQFRLFILDDLSYMNDDAEDEADRDEWAHVNEMDTPALVAYYLDIDSDWIIAPVLTSAEVTVTYAPAKTEPDGDNAVEPGA